MSARRPPRCTKVSYPHEESALASLAEIQTFAHRYPERQECRAYPCPRGNHWHLTSKPYQPGGPGRWAAVPVEGEDW